MKKRTKLAKLVVAAATDGHVRVTYRGKTIGSFTQQTDGTVAAVIVPRFLAHMLWRDGAGDYHDIPRGVPL